MELEQPNTTTEFNFSYILERAEASFKSKKFNISINHYFTLLNKGKDLTSADTYKEIVTTFFYNIFFISAGLRKEKMINFALKNNFICVSDYLYLLLLKVSKNKLILQNDLKDFSNYTTFIVKTVIDSTPDLISMSFLEHNIYSLSLAYDIISFEALDRFLGQKNVENLVFKLILESPIRAKIDQEKEVVIFIKDNYDMNEKKIHNFCSRLIAINDEFNNLVK